MHALHSIKAKLLATFLLLSLAAGVVGYIGQRGIADVSHGLDEVSLVLVPSLRSLAMVSDGYLDVKLKTRDGMIALMNKDSARVLAAHDLRDKALRRFEKGIEVYAPLRREGDEDLAWKEFEPRLVQWKQRNAAIWAALDAGDTEKAQEATALAVSNAALMQTSIDFLLDVQSRMSEVHRKAGVATTSAASRSLLLSTALALLASMVLGFYLTLSITRPLQVVTNAAARIAEGDVEQKVEHHSRDELGALADAFRAMVAYVQGVSKAADAVSRGDLSFQLTARSERDALSRNFLKLSDTLKALLAETHTLVVAAQDGALHTRGNAAAFEGGFGQLVGGVNKMMDAMLAPHPGVQHRPRRDGRAQPHHPHGRRLQG
jgi:methyl-accepting chemotaxis protein